MLIPDTNVLLHAGHRQASEHRLASRWLIGALRSHEPVGLAWSVVIAFVRLSTHPSVFPRPLTSEEAIRLVEVWLKAFPSVVVEPTRRHLALLAGLLAQAGTAGNLVSDAHLAALALEHDATVVSFDRDFQRFEGVRSRLPA